MVGLKLFSHRLKKHVQTKVIEPAREKETTLAKVTPANADTSKYVHLDLSKLASEAALKLIEQKAVSLEGLSTETLNEAFKVYQSFGLQKQAMACRRIQLERTPKNATIHDYARALFAAGDAKAALAQLDVIDTDVLTDRGHTMVLQDRITYLRSTGQSAQAYDLMSHHVAGLIGPNMANELKLAEMERQNGQQAKAHKRLSGHINRFGQEPAFLQSLSSCLAEMNRNDEALLLAALLCSVPKPLTHHVVRYIELLWQVGDVDQLCRFLPRVLRLKMSHPSLLKSLREKAHGNDRIAAFIPELELNVGSTLIGAQTPNLANIAERFYALEMFQDAKTTADKYLAFFNRDPTAYYVRGASAFYLEDYATAEQDLLRCVELNPGYFQAYSILLNVLPRRVGGVEKMAKLLEIRNAYHWKYTAYDANGRRGMLDIESSQVACMQSDYMLSQKIRQERPLCRYMQAQYPAQYDCYENPEFPATPKDSLLVITEDGVGDEVRWSQYLPQLESHYKSVEVTCDPRLLTLFQRSFPTVTFYPFKRRLMERVEEQKINPSSHVPYFSLARLIDNPLYDRLDDFDELRFSADMVRGAWAKQPDGQPLPEGPPDVAYLTPDPARVTKWGKTLNQTGKGKLKVGLVWKSSLVTPRRKKHYLELENIAALLASKGVQFYSLQAEDTPEDIAMCRKIGIEILDDIDMQDDFEEVAALCAALDLVMTVNSFMVEMGSAVGTPCWMLGAYNNLVHYRLGNSGSEIDRLNSNVTIIRIDQEDGFVGSDASMQRKLAKVAKGRLESFAKQNRENLQLTA